MCVTCLSWYPCPASEECRFQKGADVHGWSVRWAQKKNVKDKKDKCEECEETDGIQYSDNDINNFINKAKKIMLERYCELENGH